MEKTDEEMVSKHSVNHIIGSEQTRLNYTHYKILKGMCQMPLKQKKKRRDSSTILLLKHCVVRKLPANKQHFQINPHYYGQYISPGLYFLDLEVTNNYNPTFLSEGPIES